MTPRKLQALRNLAERPGTPEEGEVARRMLAKAEGKIQQPGPLPFMAMRDLEAKIMREMAAQMQMPLADLERQFVQFGKATQSASSATSAFEHAYRKFQEFGRRK